MARTPSGRSGPPRPTGLVVALAVAIAASLTGPTSPIPASAADRVAKPGYALAAGITPLASTATFYGRGYGHGVGMSQYGARGRALAGQTAAQIIDHYFTDTTLGSLDPKTPIRVLLMSKWKASSTKPLTIVGRAGGWTIDGIATTFPADARMTATPTVSGTAATWRLKVVSAGGSVLHDGAKSGTFRVRPTASGTRLELDSKGTSTDTYRGVLAVALSVTAPTVNVVNELPIDEYLRGVVPAEMPSSWPTEALRAQAITARSYAAYRLRPGKSTYDVYDDTRSQVYQGSLAERSTTNAAIAATSGVVVKRGSAIANTFFHSAGGGATENNEYAWVSASGATVSAPIAYLRGSSDRAPDGSSYDAASPYATWKTATYTVAQLSSWYGSDSRTNVGTLVGLDLRNRGVSGRLIKVVLYGTNGTKTVSGEVFRSIFNAKSPLADPAMRSTLFDLRPIP